MKYVAKKLVAFLFALIFLIILLIAFSRISIRAKTLETHSTILAIYAGLENYCLENAKTENAKWKYLTDQEYALVMRHLEDKSIDHVSTAENTGIFIDPWSNNFVIAVHNQSGQVAVWSKGRDRISGTADDIVPLPGIEAYEFLTCWPNGTYSDSSIFGCLPDFDESTGLHAAWQKWVVV